METQRRTSGRWLGAIVAIVAVIAAACGADDTPVARLDDGTITVVGGGGAVASDSLGDPVNFRWDTFDGSTAALSDLDAKPTVLNFFASWCPTCIAEMPDFESVHQAVADDVNFLGLALQDRPESALALVADTGVTYAVGIDDGDIFGIFQGLGMPTTVFIDGDRVVRKVHTGQLDAAGLRQIIDEELLS